jgi:TRAP-type transport system small permease protein
MNSDLLEPAEVRAEEEAERVPGGVERALAAAAMGVICLITFANVGVRYFTNYSFAFTEEYSIFLMVVLTLLGSAAATAADRHIRITFILNRLPLPIRPYCEAAGWFAMLLMFVVLVWYGGELAYDNWRFEETSPGLGYPQYLYTMWLPILSAVVAIRVAMRLAASLRRRG